MPYYYCGSLVVIVSVFVCLFCAESVTIAPLITLYRMFTSCIVPNHLFVSYINVSLQAINRMDTRQVHIKEIHICILYFQYKKIAVASSIAWLNQSVIEFEWYASTFFFLVESSGAC